MSNGARHTWGFFAGIVLTAALAGLLIFGTYRLQHGYVTQFHKQDKWIGGGLIAGAAVVFALLASSRLSPLASLIGGIVLTAAGILFFVSQKTTADLINRFPFKEQRVTLAGLEDEGFILYAGVGLLFASFFPSRWRARGDDGTDEDYEYGLPETSGRSSYAAPSREPYEEHVAGDTFGGRHAARDDRTYADPHAGGYDAQHTSYDSPLYEPTQQQDQPYGRRSPFSPPDEDGGTREMYRPQ
jgi:hypothetical protein